jgi:prostaglandin-H2 D-isomerase / glutathione transferase
MNRYKLSYFDIAGSRGEDCRIALSVAGIEFEDHRIQQAEWPALKASMPYGSVPVLETPGKPPLAQSNAILAYLGRSYGLHPRDAWQAARHEAIMESVEEVRAALAPTGKFQDAADKRRAREAFAAGYLTTWAGHVESQIEGPFFAGESMYVADIKVFTLVNSFTSGVIDFIDGSVFEPFPKLVKLAAAVASDAKVAAWRARFR